MKRVAEELAQKQRSVEMVTPESCKQLWMDRLGTEDMVSNPMLD